MMSAKPSVAKLLPLLSKLGSYFKAGVDHYADLKTSGVEATPEVLAIFIHAKMEGWEPLVNGAAVFDPDTKEAASRMLAGVIANLARAQQVNG